MDEDTARELYAQLRVIAGQLHDVEPADVKAYVLVTVTSDNRDHLSTNIIDPEQVRGLMARQALDRRPMRRQVPGGLF